MKRFLIKIIYLKHQGGVIVSSVKIREQNLLLFLLKNQDYVTSGDIAKELEVSVKTVYRLIKRLNEENANGELIFSEKGRGYKLNYDNFLKLKNLNKQTEEQSISPHERQKRVMEELLISSPKFIQVYKLYDRYYVGESGISNDEQVIVNKLTKFNLELIRKNRSLSINGEEKNIRNALREISDIFNIIDIEELKNNNSLNFNKYDVLFIADQIRFVETKLSIIIPYPYNVNLFSHIYILLNRIKKNQNILIEHRISKKELQDMNNKKEVLKIAKSVARHIEDYLQCELPEAEIYFLFQYLVSSRMQGISGEGNSYSVATINVTNSYIKEMEKKLNFKIDSDSIFIELANHIKPMLNRLEHDIHVSNTLLNQIEINYGEIFYNIEKVSKLISKQYSLPVISKDEIGFITLYFAKAVESNQKNNPIKTLIMCTTGIGTSELLKVKVEKKFPELNIIGVVSSRDMNQIKQEYPEAKLIISTIAIHDEINLDSLLVSAMFTLEDQKRLERKIEELHHEK